MKMIAANILANDTLYWKVSSNFSDHSLVRVENLSLFDSLICLIKKKMTPKT